MWILIIGIASCYEILILKNGQGLSFLDMGKYLKASEPKWVNTVLNTIGVNSLRLKKLLDLHFLVILVFYNFENSGIRHGITYTDGIQDIFHSWECIYRDKPVPIPHNLLVCSDEWQFSNELRPFSEWQFFSWWSYFFDWRNVNSYWWYEGMSFIKEIGVR